MGGTFWAAMVILVILFILSLILLGIRLSRYAQENNREVMLQSNTDLEGLDMFSIMYKNEGGSITVESSDNNKVIAPGTKDDFVIYLRNKEDLPLRYTLTIRAELIGQYEIPVTFWLVGPDGEDIVASGKGSTWVLREELHGTEHTAPIDIDQSRDYHLYWEWPFETDDDYDTLLGNITGEDIGIRISVDVVAETDTDAPVNFWKTSCGRTLPWIVFAILLLAAIILLIFSLLKDREDDRPEAPELLPEPEPEEIPMVIPPAIVGPIPMPEPEPEPVVVPPPAPKPKPKPKAPPKKKEGFVGKMAYINIDTLAEHFEDGAKITLAILKAKGLMEPETKQMKILARNAANVDKKFIIETQGISAEARKYIIAAGGKVIITKG